VTTRPKFLRPFWRYYGGKWRAAPRYPAPMYRTIVEPFAGAAGYAMRYYTHDVVLVEKYPVVAEIWRYLISADPQEIRATPAGIVHVDELPAWVPQGLRHLIGFSMNAATVSPCRSLSAGQKKLLAAGHTTQGWSTGMRERVASQVQHIRHWKLIEGDYTAAPDIEATWFVDPPYSNRAGSYYVHSDIDYNTLARWCERRVGQVLVCENEGAQWLPFKPFAVFKAGVNGKGSREVLWAGGLRNQQRGAILERWTRGATE